MRPPLSYVPALFPLCGFIAGMLVFEWVGHDVITLTVVPFLIGILLICFRRNLPDWIRIVVWFVIFYCAGVYDMSISKSPAVMNFPDDTRWWSGEALAKENNDRGCHLTLRLDTMGIGALVHTPHGISEQIEVGDIVSVHTSLLQPVNDDVPGCVDYVSILNRKGIILTGFADSVEFKGHHDTWKSYAAYWSARIASLLQRSRVSSDTCGFLLAVLVGDDEWLDDDTRDAFSAAGLAHVLALSGLHVGILIALVSLIFMPIGLWCDWRLRCAMIVVVLWIYAFITGLSPSVTRSVLMASMMSGGIILQRPYVSINGMFAAALIILIVSPMQLWNVGFQMSFLAVGGILLFVPPVSNAIRHMGRWCRWIILTLVISLSAMASTSILALYYFDIYPVYFLLANIPMAIILPLLMVAGMLLMVCEALGFDPLWLCQIIDFVYAMIEDWTIWIGTMPSSVIKGVDLEGIILLPYYALLVLLAIALWYRRTVFAIIGVLGMVGLFVSVALFFGSRPEQVRFVPRNSYVTSLICYNAGGEVAMLTTAPPMIARSLQKEYTERYQRFLAIVKSDSMHLYSTTDVIPVVGKVVLVYDDSVLTLPISGKMEYAVICRGYKDGWVKVLERYDPNAIVLSADIPKRRHLRLLDSIRISGVPVISLREKSNLP